MSLSKSLRNLLIWMFLVGLPLAALCGVPRPVETDALLPPELPDQSLATARAVPRRLPPTTPPALAEQPWFVAAEGELQRLGASYVRLEKWNSEPAVYYFECQLPSPANRQHGDSIATLSSLSASPQQATEDVIQRLRNVRELAPIPTFDKLRSAKRR